MSELAIPPDEGKLSEYRVETHLVVRDSTAAV